METKEAIEFVNSIVNGIEKVAFWSSDDQIKPLKEGAGQVIELLQRGEKHEKMWKEIYFHHSTVFLHDEHPEILLEKRMDEIEQKYFPKSSEDFTKKVMAKINKIESTS